MDRVEFIEYYKKKNPENYIDDEKISSLTYDGKRLYLYIDDCLKIINIYDEFYKYIYDLNKGDEIEKYHYGDIIKVKIVKINYRHKNSKRISSITYKTDNNYLYNLEIGDIVYKGNKFSDVKDSYLHCSGFYSFFNEYDIEDVKKIIENYNK